MEYKVLGPVEVFDGQRRVDLGSPRQRAILAILLLEANRVVSLDRLIDELWHDEPPAQATGTLQAYISNLRRVLEPQRAPRERPRVLMTEAPGYVVRIEPDELDAFRFEAAASEGRRLLTSGHPAEALVRLDEALALWRGPALADLAFERFAQAYVTRLELLRLDALESHLETCLDLGRHTDAVAEAEGLVAAHPLRERLWVLLMVALYRSGRQAEALRAYHTARTKLTEELGVEPGPALRQVEDDILAQAASLEWHPPSQPHRTDGHQSMAPAAAVSARPEAPRLGSTFVGREPELRSAEACLDTVADGRGAVVLVYGEPGIGKTRLVEELTIRAQARNFTVAWGAAFEDGATPAYWPWVSVVRALLDTVDAEVIRDALGGGAADLAQIVPEIKEFVGPLDAPPALDPPQALFRLFEVVCSFLKRLSRRAPLVLVLDDLHWADPASLQLLAFLGPHLGETRIMLVGTYRPAEVSSGHPLAGTLATLSRVEALRRIALSGLAEPEVGRLIAAVTGNSATGDVIAAVEARTEGNPFFVAELARLLHADHDLDPDVLADAVPAGVRDVVRRRFARLPDETRALLTLAAVVGREFELDVLETAADLEPEVALDMVEAGLASGLVVEHGEKVGHLRFSHDLVRETVAQDLTALRRARMHARIAEALEDVHGGADRHAIALAHHFTHAALGTGIEDHADKAVAHALRAAEIAGARVAYDQAEEQLRLALSVCSRTSPPAPARQRRELEVLVKLSSLLMVTKGYAASETGEALSRAQELSMDVRESRGIAPVLYGLMAFHAVSARCDASRRTADQLLELAKRSEDPAELLVGHLAVGIAAVQQGDLQACKAHIEQALLHDGEMRDPWLVSWYPADLSVACSTMLAWGVWLLGERETAIRLTAESLATADASGHGFTTGHALLFAAWIAVWERDVSLSAERAGRLVNVASDMGFPLYAAMGTVFRGWARAQLGEAEAGTAEINDGLAAMESTGAGMLRTFFLALLAEAYLAGARHAEALAAVEQALRLVDTTGERFYAAELHRLRGSLVLELWPERAREGEQELRAAIDVARLQGARALEERAENTLRSLLAR